MEVFVQLRIISDILNSDDIAFKVNMQCDSSWKVGDFRANTTMRRTNNGWVIESLVSRSEEIQCHVKSILDRLSPSSRLISSISSEAEVLISCAIYADEVPSLYFSKDIVQQMSQLGADFDIDLNIVD